MKIPQSAFLLLGRNCEYIIEKIHFDTKQVMLKENEKVFNTVSVKNVRFNYAGFSDSEIEGFLNTFNS